MHKAVLASAIVALFVGATGADAVSLDKDASPYASKSQRLPPMNDGSSSARAAPEGRAGYSARDLSDNGAHARDPAFSPQQDESYDGRF